MTRAIPTIDLTPIAMGELGGDDVLARSLDDVLRTWGAFTLVGHGVAQPIIDGAFAAARQFFDQPLAARLALKVNKHNRGYVPMHQTVYEGNLPDLKESFNLGLPLLPDDPDVVVGKPLHGVNVWPDLPGYRDRVEGYFSAMMQLGDRLLGPLALCLGMPPESLRSRYCKPIAFMRLFHYPPDSRVAEREYGAAEHQDYGFLTILAQDAAGGLEVRAPDGDLLGVTPRPDAFTVNLGDMVARMTGGRFRSAPHRVINRAGVGRYSIPFFYDPDFDARFDGMPDMSAGEFLLSKFNKFYTYRKGLAAAS
jgi:isopenicillin N synthase-like dioxygenase